MIWFLVGTLGILSKLESLQDEIHIVRLVRGIFDLMGNHLAFAMEVDFAR